MPSTTLIPAELAEIIATHRVLFGGFKMMAEENPISPPADPAPTGGDPKGEPADEPLKEPGLKALQAERDARQKAENELAALRKAQEDANKTAEEKAAEALKTAQTEAATATARALKYEVAAEKGIPLTRAHRLSGSTREEIEKDADTYLSEHSTDGAKPPAPTPKPDPSAGHSGDPKPKTLSDAISAHYTT